MISCSHWGMFPDGWGEFIPINARGWASIPGLTEIRSPDGVTIGYEFTGRTLELVEIDPSADYTINCNSVRER